MARNHLAPKEPEAFRALSALHGAVPDHQLARFAWQGG